MASNNPPPPPPPPPPPKPRVDNPNVGKDFKSGTTTTTTTSGSGGSSGSSGGTGSYVSGTGFVTSGGTVYPSTNPNWAPTGYTSTGNSFASAGNTGQLPPGTYNGITVREGPANGVSPIPISRDTSGRPVSLVPGSTTGIYVTQGGGLSQTAGFGVMQAQQQSQPKVTTYQAIDYQSLTAEQKKATGLGSAMNNANPGAINNANPGAIQNEAKPRSDYTGGEGVVSAAPKSTLKLFGWDTGWAFKPRSSGSFAAQSKQFSGSNYKAETEAAVASFGLGVFEGVSAPVLNTEGFVKGTANTFVHPLDTAKDVSISFADNPYGTVGQFTGSAILFKGISKATPNAVKAYIPEVSTPLKIIDDQITLQGGKGFSLATEAGTYKSTTYGFEVKGREIPVFSIQKTIPNKANVLSFEDAGGSLSTRTSVRPGSMSSFKVSPEDFTGQVAAPENALGGNTFRNSLNVPPEQVIRSQASVTAVRQLQYDKGLPVKDVIFNLQNVKNPSKVTALTEQFAAKEGGVFFGSTTTQQLPKGYQNLKVGDIDIVFPSQSVAELTPKVAKLSEQYNLAGESTRVSAKNPLVIESAIDSSKIFESKSGIDQFTLGEELAPAGFYGIKFADLKKGQVPKTVAFGEARAITAGEQFARKGSAVNIVRPSIKEGMKGFEGEYAQPVALREGGIMGAPHRSAKDIAGYIQSGRGLINIRETQGSWNPFRNLETARAKTALTTFEQSFSGEQQVAINAKLADLTGETGSAKIPLSNSLMDTKINTPIVDTFGSAASFFGESKAASFKTPVFADMKSPSFAVESPTFSSFSSPKSPLASAFASPSDVRSAYSSPSLMPSKTASPSTYNMKAPSAFTSPSSYKVNSPSVLSSPSAFTSPSGYGGGSPGPVSPSPYSSKSPSSSPSPMSSPSGYGFSSYKGTFGSKSSIFGTFGTSKKQGKRFGTGYLVQIKRKGKYVTEGVNLTRSQALGIGQMKTMADLSATFRIKKDFSPVEEDSSMGRVNKNVFRDYSIRKGKKIQMEDTFIQRRSQRLSSGGEVGQIQRARAFRGIF